MQERISIVRNAEQFKLLTNYENSCVPALKLSITLCGVFLTKAECSGVLGAAVSSWK